MATTRFSITLDEITLMTKPICADTHDFVSTSSASAEIDSGYDPWPRTPQRIAGGLPGMRYWIGNCCVPASSVHNPITSRMIRQLANAVKLTAIILGCGSGVIGATPGGSVGSKYWATSRSLGTSHQISALREPASVLSRPLFFCDNAAFFAA